MTNGMLSSWLATVLLALPHRVGPRAVRVMVPAVWLTSTMALSEAANAWWGATQVLPIVSRQRPEA